MPTQHQQALLAVEAEVMQRRRLRQLLLQRVRQSVTRSQQADPSLTSSLRTVEETLSAMLRPGETERLTQLEEQVVRA